MTLAQVIDLMRGVLDDDATTKYWPDGDLVQMLGAAQSMFMAVAPEDALSEVEAETKLDAVAAGTGETVSGTSLPATFARFRAARVRRLQTGTFYSAKLIPLPELLAQERSTSSQKATEISPVCAVWGGKLWYSPTPSDTTSTIQLFYLANPTAITAGTATSTSLTVNAVHQYALAEYGLYLAFEKMDPQRAGLHLQAFAAYVQGIGGRWPVYHMAAPEPRRVAGPTAVAA